MQVLSQYSIPSWHRTYVCQNTCCSLKHTSCAAMPDPPTTLTDSSDTEQKSLSARRFEATRVLAKYPDRVPVICERSARCHSLPVIDKKKYLVPRDLTVGNFICVIRKRMAIKSEMSIFVCDGAGHLPPTSSTIASVFQTSRSPDGFLYLRYTGENTFGQTS